MGKRREEERILDMNATMKGSLVFSDPVNLRINGKFEGDLTTKGKLIIGENADVKANIDGENITIAGSIRGEIKATNLLKFTSTANVVANVEVFRISIESGAVFDGTCKMLKGKISLEELSDYLSIEEDKIMEWVNDGKIPAEKKSNNLVFDRKEVEDWVAQKS